MKSKKQFTTTVMLAFFLGGIGAHRFYVGKKVSGVLMLLTLGGLGIWSLVDFVNIILGKFKDSEGLEVQA